MNTFNDISQGIGMVILACLLWSIVIALIAVILISFLAVVCIAPFVILGTLIYEGLQLLRRK